MSLNNMLDGLDAEQKKAVTLETNGVVAAGAGSGKTKVLASRYVWLVMEKNLKPEEIITLTFTNKAVSEMYSRIYRYLLDEADEDSGGDMASGGARAARALREFHKARIGTLDSFSAGIARTAAARYGISPDFASDDAALRTMAKKEALAFVLNHREVPATRTLLVDHKIRILAEEIFARVVLQYSPISSPLELDTYLTAQKESLLDAWEKKSKQVDETSKKIIEELKTLTGLKKSIGFTKSLEDILCKAPPPAPPDIMPLLETDSAAADTELAPHAEWNSDSRDSGTKRRMKGINTAGQSPAPAAYGGLPQQSANREPLVRRFDGVLNPSIPHSLDHVRVCTAYAAAISLRSSIKTFFDYYSALVAARLPGNYGDVYAPVVELFRRLKGKDGDGLYHELQSIANYALNFDLCAGVFRLVKKFQNEFNAKKRETGFLSFNDIAHLAVDALRDHPDIRKIYKDSVKAIMIDEFQDNNALQRDLIYLLAENPERSERGMPAPSELEKNRMFFVGDEKQSIYRFRGADVSVFRSLAKGLSGAEAGGSVGLVHNYRSRPPLIAALNHIFSGVFPDAAPGVPDYEAEYMPIKPPESSGEKKSPPLGEIPPARFCFLNGNDLPKDDTGGVKSQDLEAAFIAEKIRDMVTKKEKIPGRADTGTEWLPCTWKDFAVLERSYTYQSALEKYFREFGIPYNTDRPSGLFNEAPILDLRAYLRLLVYPEDRIAYAALIRSPFTRLGDLTLAVCMLCENPEPFTEENDALIPEEDRGLYRRARERYRALRELSRSLPVTELVTRLWFEEGYRFETLWSQSAQVYESLFDLFFSLASESDKRGGSLADFIEYLEDMMNREEKPGDRDIPGEGEAGVRIMSIHKSKGLEFPVVFIYDAARSGNTGLSKGMLHCHEKYGLILNVPQAEELPDGGNYFLKLMAEEEKAKSAAELRRLLYVAATRAEYRLFLTFTLPRQTEKEKKDWDMGSETFSEGTIRRRLEQLNEKTEGKETFLSLLEGILLDCPPELCAFETIPVLSRAEISALAARPRAASMPAASIAPNGTVPAGGRAGRFGGNVFLNQREAALAAESFYAGAGIIPGGKAGPISLQASNLRYVPEKRIDPGRREEAPDDASGDGRLDALLEKFGVNPADFGTLVHAVLEERLSGRPRLVPPGIRRRVEDEKPLRRLVTFAESMADTFLASELGKRWAASGRRESEFPIITSAAPGNSRSIAITGQIDLLFEEDNEVAVVDFKTGRIENDEEYYGQLAAYYRAAGDIFGKPVSLWLCYLRSGRIVNVTEKVKNLSLEEMAKAALAPPA